MYRIGGQSVDKPLQEIPRHVGFSVDRKALNVRNRHACLLKGAHVGNRGTRRASCSSQQSVRPQELALLVHKSTVPTGTTSIVLFLKD